MQPSPPPILTPQKKSNVALVVVLICVAAFCLILPIMAAILFPVFSQARLSAQKGATMANAKQIALALMMYSATHDDKLPPQLSSAADLRTAAEPFGVASAQFLSKNPAGGEFLPNGSAEGLNLILLVQPELDILIYESTPWERDGGRVVGRFDGSAAYIKSFNESTMLGLELSPKE